MPVIRPADERGMTLIEVLVAMTIALVISMAAFALIDFTMRRSGDINGRIDANRRGRMAMDVITRQLRSQVCQPSGTVPMVGGTTTPTDQNNASFFVDLTDGSDPTVAPQLHRIAYDAANQRFVETDWTAKVGADPSVDPVYNTPPTTKVLLTNVLRIPGTPVFSYYAFNGTAPLAVPVTGTALGTIARIQVNFRVAPSGSRATDPDPRGSVDFQDQVFVREVDPNAASPKVQCS